MTEPKKTGDSLTRPLLKIAAGFLAVGLFLFFHVWLPVQAERSLLELTQVEQQLSRKKSELNELKSRYSVLTALPVLDQWAKTHGPWVTPNKNNVIPFEK
jgi:hypothetical protein